MQSRLFAVGRLVLVLVALGVPALAERQSVALGARSYLIDLPDQPTGAAIIALHGAGGNPAQFATQTGLSDAALAQGYAVIYPAGSGTKRKKSGALLTWNAGNCCGEAGQSGSDDVGFLDAVAADATRRFALDRLYVTGVSNGAMMAERFASAGRTPVRAVAGVAGTMDLVTNPPPRPVPLLVIHGTADDHVIYAGGPGGSGYEDVTFTGVARLVAVWRAAFAGPLTEKTSVIDPADDGMRSVLTDLVDPSGAVPLRLLTVEGGGHTWPGGQRAAGQANTRDISATAEILKFFALWP